jgi:hypothetical protein
LIGDDDEKKETTYVTPMLVLNCRERSKPYQKVFGISRCIGKKVEAGYSEHLVMWLCIVKNKKD